VAQAIDNQKSGRASYERLPVEMRIDSHWENGANRRFSGAVASRAEAQGRFQAQGGG